jgi:hypothetical protein
MCLAAASTGVSAFAQVPPSPQSGPPVVVTNGEGVIKRAPDRAWVTITAESRAKTAQEAQKQNASVMAAVLTKVKGAGIPADAIQTAGYDLQPEYDFHEGRQTLRGYVARNSVEVRVDALPRLGEIVEVAVSSGATMVRGVRFDLKDRSAIERDALKLAVADARHRADALAEGAGMKVENVIRIQELGASEPPRPVMMGMARTEALQVTGAPPIEAGEIEIRVAVTITATIR